MWRGVDFGTKKAGFGDQVSGGQRMAWIRWLVDLVLWLAGRPPKLPLPEQRDLGDFFALIAQEEKLGSVRMAVGEDLVRRCRVVNVEAPAESLRVLRAGAERMGFTVELSRCGGSLTVYEGRRR
jgi:hypothetical protein